MFTGIIEEIGSVRQLRRRYDGAELVIAAKTVLEGTADGDSINVSGACLTVTQLGRDSLTFDVSSETLERTCFRYLRIGSHANLERATTPETRLGGHLVMGHVDGVGRVIEWTRHATGGGLVVSFPAELARQIADKGSIAVDGISLTPYDVTETTFRVAVIPETVARTTVADLEVGDRVNLETDILAKYVHRLLGTKNELTEERLRDAGF